MKKELLSYDPSNGAEIGRVTVTPVEEIENMVKRGRLAQKKWAALTIAKRKEILMKGVAEFEKVEKELALLISKEMGKPLGRAMGEASSCSASMEYMTTNVSEAIKTTEVEGYGMNTKVMYKPLGVCAIVTPWNYPVSMGNWLVIPSLMAGNAVILKPSEETPLCGELYVKTFSKVLPKDLIQVVQGDGIQGEALVNSSVDFIGFTGSRETGKRITQQAVRGLKPVVMELGGKDPLIVMKDADVVYAARFAVANSFENTGQMCISTERVLVDSHIAEEFEKEVVEHAKKYKAGPWTEEDSRLGPIVNKKQREKILHQIEDAIQKGGKVLLGGLEQPERYITPTVITNVTEDMLLETEETFGPIVAIQTFENIEEAIEKANNTKFGLGAVVYGGKDAEAVAERLEAGMIGINRSVEGLGDTPWVGMKESGYGYHGSPDGHRQFTKPQVLSKRI